MQDELNERIIVFSIHTAKITGEAIIKAVQQYLDAKKTSDSEIPHGKQTLKQLIQQNAGVSDIEVSSQNIKLFEAAAKKYGVDYAVKKQKSDQGMRYLVFFKGRDADAVTAALTEISSMKLHQKPSIKAMLAELKTQINPPEIKPELSLGQIKAAEKER